MAEPHDHAAVGASLRNKEVIEFFEFSFRK